MNALPEIHNSEHKLYPGNPDQGDSMNPPLGTTSTTSAAEALVTTTKPATIPFGVRAGMTTDTILQIETLFENGESQIVFRCADCGKDFDAYGSTFAHRRVHAPGSVGMKGGNKIVAVAREMAALRKEVRSLERRLSREQSRRKAAEKRLKDIDRVFHNL